MGLNAGRDKVFVKLARNVLAVMVGRLWMFCKSATAYSPKGPL